MSLVHTIDAPTRVEAWVRAAAQIVETGPSLNVILAIDSPQLSGLNGKATNERVDDFLKSEGQYPLHTVAETIFPGWEYAHRGFRGLVKAYTAEYDTLDERNQFRWGTYANRIIRGPLGYSKTLGPLENLVNKMRSENESTKKGPFRAIYELNVSDTNIDVPIYSDEKDQGYRRGGPCLSHLSFKLFEGKVHLSATYRIHDYRYKVLGNLLGLARLQTCVAREVGVPPGGLVVHSTYAYIEQGDGKTKFRDLLSEVRHMSSGVEESVESADR